MASSFNIVEMLENLFRSSCGFPPPMARTVFAEQHLDHCSYLMWCGSGFYELTYEQAVKVIESKDVAGGLKYVSREHPAHKAWPVLQRIVGQALGREWADRATRVMLETYGKFDPSVELTEEARTILGIEAMRVLEEQLVELRILRSKGGE